MQKKSYNVFEGGALENEIAGKNVNQPLGVLMCYAELLAVYPFNEWMRN